MKTDFTTLDAMIRSREFENYISSKLGNDLFINDPNRAERIADYAEEGGDGSSHAEIIEDWREFFETLKCFDPEFDDIEDIDRYDITLETKDAIEKEIQDCQDWHQENGTLHTIIG